MEKFTNSAYNRDAVSFKDAFEETLASKVFDALEAKKLEVAQNIFNGEVEIKEHGNDGFGSNKTSGNVTKGWPSPKHPGQGLPKTKEHKMEEAKMCPHCEKSMSKCSCEHMEEEVEQIDELSKDTLKSYHDKAHKKNLEISSKPTTPESLRKYRKHSIGQTIAMSKLTGIQHTHNGKKPSFKNEEVELDEGMHKHEKKHGKMHHKLAKKMMKLAHKHAKKHDHEEEEE
jgi:hypothetical protein